MIELRIAYRLGIAVAEATVVAFVLTLLGNPLWFPLVLVVLAGLLLNLMLAGRDLPQRTIGAWVAGGGLVLGALVGKYAAGGGVNPLSGWGAATFEVWLFYSALMGSMFAFWRGTLVLHHDTESLQMFFRRVMFGMILFTSVTLFGASAAQIQRISVQIIFFFALMLVLMPLGRALAVSQEAERTISRRSLTTVLGAIGAVVGATLLLLTVAGEQFRGLIIGLLQLVLVIPIGIAAVLANILAPLLAGLIDQGRLNTVLEQLGQRANQQPVDQLPETTPPVDPPMWLWVVQVAVCLIPVLLLVLIIFVVSRRAAASPPTDEERSSQFSLQALASDLGGLFRRNAPGTASDRLAHLHGNDPATRIRRAYARLMVLAESRDQPRDPHTTPREFAADPARSLPPPDALQSLTDAYERARYHPGSTTDTDAARAEDAWKRIEQQP